MPFDGTGNFNPTSPEYPAVSGTLIEAADWNAIIADIAAGLTNCVTRDGQSPMTAPLNMGGQNIINAGHVNGTNGVFTGNGSFGGTLTAGGAVTFAGALNVTGLVTTTGAINVGGTLGVTSSLTVGSTITAGGQILAVSDFKAGSGAAGEKKITFHNAARQCYLYLNDGATFGLWDATGGAARWTTDTSGNFTASGNVTAFSDERVKYDWKKLPSDFVSKLAKVRSGTYSRRDVALRQVGVGAGSLSEVLPEAVVEDANGMLSVAYGNAALSACIELAKEVVALRKRLAKLEAA